MPLINRLTDEYIYYLKNGNIDWLIDSMPWYKLTPCELCERLLRRSRLVQYCFPKTAFLLALDSPKYVKYTTH